jgi:hypothetical protein
MTALCARMHAQQESDRRRQQSGLRRLSGDFPSSDGIQVSKEQYNRREVVVYGR